MEPAQPIPPAVPAAAEVVSGGSLAASLLDLPANANPAPIPPGTPVAGDAAKDPAQPLDALNKPFRPGFHRVKADGSPFTGQRGQFMPRGGRKPGLAGEQAKIPFPKPAPAAVEAPRRHFVPPVPPVAAPTAASGPETPGAAPLPPPPAPISRTAHEQTAEGYLRTAYFAFDKIFAGKGEWRPDGTEEHAGLKEPLVEHLTVTNGKPLPSWARFVVAAVIYVLNRFDRPNTAKTAAKYWAKMNGKPAEKRAEPTAPDPQQPAKQASAQLAPARPVNPLSEHFPS